MAMDMGGSNVRVTKYQLKGNGLLEIVKEVRRSFPESYMMGTADQVFGFLAKCVQDVLPNPGIKFGFTFSFPCSQTSINRSTIVEWTKGFSASGCIGNDPALMLEECLRQRGIDLHVTAICNDTVGTLISRSYWDPKTAVGIILGTGCLYRGCRSFDEDRYCDSNRQNDHQHGVWSDWNEPSHNSPSAPIRYRVGPHHSKPRETVPRKDDVWVLPW